MVSDGAAVSRLAPVLVASLCAGLLVSSPAAAAPAHAGVAAFDAAREKVLFGGLPSGPAKAVPSATTVGTWRDDQGALALAEQAPNLDGLWLAQDSLADGLVRLRIAVDGKLDLSLVLRGEVGRSDGGAIQDLLSGYGVSLAGDRVRLDRWDRGLAFPLTPAARVAGLGKRRQLELVAMALGPQISVQLYDGASFELLASVSARDESYAGGRVGVRAGPKQGLGHRFTLLSVMALGAGPNRPAPGGSQGPYGGLRYHFIRPEERERLPADLRGKVQALPVEGIASELALLLGPADAERLRRTGVTVVAERGELPWAATDPELRARRGRPPEATPTGYRVDASYKDPELVEGLLRAYADRFSAIARLRELGRSHGGRPILALKISDAPERDEDEPAVLINGAHHGSELMATEYTLDVVQRLLEGYADDPAVRRRVDGLEIWCVPLVNPDGNYYYMHRSRAAGRKNGRDNDGDGALSVWDGVDLNRNYPFMWGALGELGSRSFYSDGRYRGPAAASEPEVQAIVRLAQERRFAAAISFHTLATAVLSPYTIDGALNPARDEAWALAERLVAAAPPQPNGRRYNVRRKLYPVDGTDQDWHRFAHGTLAFLVEGSHHNPREPALRAAAVAATRPVWTALLDAVLDGPGISGHVRDSAGAPVEVEVVVEEVQPQQGERWTSRPRDGRFDRSVPAPGRYTVRAAGPAGCPPTRRTLDVRRRETVELVVPAQPCAPAR